MITDNQTHKILIFKAFLNLKILSISKFYKKLKKKREIIVLKL